MFILWIVQIRLVMRWCAASRFFSEAFWRRLGTNAACQPNFLAWIAAQSHLGGKGWKPLCVGHCFSVFWTAQGISIAKPSQALLLCGYTVAIITAHAPGRTSGRVQAPGPTPSAPKQRKSDVHVKSQNPVSGSARDRHWRYSRKHNHRECSNIKEHVWVHWQAHCHAKWPKGSREF